VAGGKDRKGLADMEKPHKRQRVGGHGRSKPKSVGDPNEGWVNL